MLVRRGLIVAVRRLRDAAVLAVAGALGVSTLVVNATAPAGAVQVPQDSVVSANPADWTPDVMDGTVESIVEVGDRIVVAGTFTQVKEKGVNKPILERSRIFAFDPANGRIDENFKPTLDGDVNVVLPARDGTSVYLGGGFKTVNGVTNRRVTRLDLATGQITAGFLNAGFDAKITDLRLAGDHLIAAGAFTQAWGVTRTGLLSLNPQTGRPDSFITSTLSEPRAGNVSVLKMDVTPDESKLVVIGNFAKVDGQSRPQLAMFDTAGSQATLSDWRTPFYDVALCSKSFWSYMRDLDIDPEGEYMVVTTTGAYGGSESPCDVEARFELGATGQDIQPTWKAYTGGDTTYAVAVTGSVVYVGGHMRRMNNPWAGDAVGAGSVERAGLAALDPETGVPFTWNPGRQPRGVGVFDILATDSGLYIGSDTDWTAEEQHRKLAFFPLEGGAALPDQKVGALPNDVYTVGANGDSVRRQYLDGSNNLGPTETLTGAVNGPADWSNARGATLIDDKIIAAWADGSFKSISFDGATFGPVQNADLGANSNTGRANWFGTDAPSVTGMFFDPATNRMYYTKSGDTNLWYRGFNTESQLIAAKKYPAAGAVSTLAPSRVRGMFLSGQELYFADSSNGFLYKVGFVDGAVVGPAALVSNTVDWRSKGMFLWNGEPKGEVASPNAKAAHTASGLDVHFDGSESNDPDGVVVDWSWSFGDGSSGSGKTVDHTYTAAGTYSVTLTVTDNTGRTGTKVFDVTVAPPRERAIDFRDSSSVTGQATTARVGVPASVQADDAMLMFVTSADGVAVDAPAGWTLVGDRQGKQIRTSLYSRVATGSDAGSSVQIGLAASTKFDVTLLAYSRTDAQDPVLAWAAADEQLVTTDHLAPDVARGPETIRVVSFWADKSSATTAWTVPSDLARRSQSFGSGGGRVTSVAADALASPAPNGVTPGATAVANSATAKATMWSVSLRPAE